jgi:hypothetical protein
VVNATRDRIGLDVQIVQVETEYLGIIDTKIVNNGIVPRGLKEFNVSPIVIPDPIVSLERYMQNTSQTPVYIQDRVQFYSASLFQVNGRSSVVSPSDRTLFSSSVSL